MATPLLEFARETLDRMDQIRQRESGESLVLVRPDKKLFRSRQSPWSTVMLFGHHYLRESVFEKLYAAAKDIKNELGGRYRVLILDTYRPLQVQATNFALVSTFHRLRNSDLKTQRDVDSFTNMLVALPKYAPHPCGAAVDMTLMDLRTGEALVFGDEQMATIFGDATEPGTPEPPEHLKPLYEAMCEAMKEQGFVMTPCEWWHFAYGDSEWADLSGEGETLFQAVPWEPGMAFGAQDRWPV